ncbi:unnamed protein product [Soboliphyme baturini]|uniref:Kunitz/Bovine pancreatic trypsin inhibitor domain protein n=1 Tax=Soboliphyme baturini TaxID=241478 RepID=A0A183IGH9_9BILA|nr:unnamed protein product [Soboliphyme baturini]
MSAHEGLHRNSLQMVNEVTCHLKSVDTHYNGFCNLPAQVGAGPYRIPRWFFNRQANRCDMFFYSGCGGNDNIFITLAACSAVCAVNPCTLSPNLGAGGYQQRRFFFNFNTRTCESYLFFGGYGNRNNFESLQECQEACPEDTPCRFGNPMKSTTGQRMFCGLDQVKEVCPWNSYCHIGGSEQMTMCCPKGEKEPCLQNLERGRGNSELKRWYFDGIKKQCFSFIYLGLGGNENNFLSKNFCSDACEGMTNLKAMN